MLKFIHRLQIVQQKIAEAASSHQQKINPATLLFVTKTLTEEQIANYLALLPNKCLPASNPVFLGENKAQDLKRKAASPLLKPFNIQWHFIGKLQKNKIKDVVPFIHMLHSLHSSALAAKLQQFLQRIHKNLEVLIQVNTSQEPNKNGIPPENCLAFLKELNQFPRLHVKGFMTMAKLSSKQQQVRASFQTLASLKLQANQAAVYHSPLHHLSMGMSNDFQWALADGATIIRLGSFLFSSP